tara:strand:+ start:2005 stop:2709 length:705 start_codon:yes stop_codon:yes gene_type:complete
MIQGLLGLSGGNNQMFGSTGFAPNRMQVLQELVRRHNAGELNLPDEQVKQLAKAAASAGLKFNVESKPVRKALFDAADTLALGLIPNELRPRSIGEDVFGESLLDRTAGLAGSVGGGLGLGSLALRGAGKIFGGINNFMNKRSAAGMRANFNATNFSGVDSQNNLLGTTQMNMLSGRPQMNMLNPFNVLSLPPGAINLGPGTIPLGRGYRPFGSGLNRGGTQSIPVLQQMPIFN